MCPTTVPPQAPGTGFRMRVGEYQRLVFPVPFLEKWCVEVISITGGKGDFEWLNQGSWSEIAEDTKYQVLWWVYCMTYTLKLEGNGNQEGRFMQWQAGEIPAAQLFCWKTRCTRHLRASIWGPFGFDLLKTPEELLKLWFPCFFAHAVSFSWNALSSYSPPHVFLLCFPIQQMWCSSQKPPGNRWAPGFGLFLHLHVEWPLRPLDTEDLLQSCSNSSSSRRSGSRDGESTRNGNHHHCRHDSSNSSNSSTSKDNSSNSRSYHSSSNESNIKNNNRLKVKTSLVVQWLRLHLPMHVEGWALLWGAKFPHASPLKYQNIKQKQQSRCYKFNKDLKMVHIQKV